mmetsp:Transcript_69988/g.121573  ORF Transcript_69988/g.121573 Transcript_69988/m.121573 type:complete len:233 (-) Transcript_69988:296-994(-)
MCSSSESPSSSSAIEFRAPPKMRKDPRIDARGEPSYEDEDAWLPLRRPRARLFFLLLEEVPPTSSPSLSSSSDCEESELRESHSEGSGPIASELADSASEELPELSPPLKIDMSFAIAIPEGLPSGKLERADNLLRLWPCKLPRRFFGNMPLPSPSAAEVRRPTMANPDMSSAKDVLRSVPCRSDVLRSRKDTLCSRRDVLRSSRDPLRSLDALRALVGGLGAKKFTTVADP